LFGGELCCITTEYTQKEKLNTSKARSSTHHKEEVQHFPPLMKVVVKRSVKIKKESERVKYTSKTNKFNPYSLYYRHTISPFLGIV